MNEHAGASCALSVLIVGVFAVLLHQKEPLPPANLAPVAPVSKPAATSLANASKPVPPPTPPEPQATAKPHPTPPPTSASVPGPVPKAVENREVVAVAPPPSRNVVPGQARPRAVMARAPTSSRSAFTEVQAGETLAEVALRVYGSADRLEELWKANRDQLATPDAPLAGGMLLRTP